MLDGITEGYLKEAIIERDRETGLYCIVYKPEFMEPHYLNYNNSFYDCEFDSIDFQSVEDALKYKEILLGYK